LLIKFSPQAGLYPGPPLRSGEVRTQKNVEPRLEFKVTIHKGGSNETTPKDCQNSDFAVDKGRVWLSFGDRPDGIAIVILKSMSTPRTLPLFDPHARPQSWNERVVLTIVDWRADFGMLWPAMFGTRMIPAGLFLLGTDLIINFEAKRKRRRGALKVP
jgi:hypothetical protein